MFQKIFNFFKPKVKKENKYMLYDVIVIDSDEDGNRQHQESGVRASSRKELQGLYAMVGSRIQILREYADPNDKSEQSIQAQPINIKTTQPPEVQAQIQTPQISTPIKQVIQSKPKFFKVANIECKLENDKLYQKQWIKLSGNEEQNYRIIQDNSNKIVSLDGKHIEKLSWVLVEDENVTEPEEV